MRGNRAVRLITELGAGDHLCCIYETEEEHRAIITPYMRLGLERGEKVLYIVDARTASEILEYLERDGVQTRSYLQSGQLRMLTVEDSYMKGGVFDPDGMIELLSQETELALSEGYSALRVTGEMTWALRGLPGSEKLMEYEAKLNQFFPGKACLAICQYDRRRFGPHILLDVLTTHPIAVIGTEIYDNFYYVPPEEFLGGALPVKALDARLRNLRERGRAEESLRRSEERFRTLVDSAPVSISIFQDGRVRYANPACVRMTGYSLEEQMAMDTMRMVHEDYREQVSRRIEAILSGKAKPSQYEMKIITKSGEERWWLVGASLVDYEGRPAVLGIGRDVTENKRAEEELAWALEVNKAVAELSSRLLATSSIEDISYAVLEIARRLTGSPYGYVGYIDTDTGYLVSPTLTRDIWDECGMEDKKVVFKEFTGLWGWVLENRRPLLTNRPREDGRSRGVPHGHIPIERFISVPAQVGEILTGQISLANAPRDYGSRDLALLERLADLYAIAVLRMWSDDELDRYRRHLEVMVKERTLDLQRINERLQREIGEREGKERELKETMERLRALSAGLQHAREEERRRIAMDVHDRLGQALTGLKINLSLLGRKVAGDAESVERLQSMSDLIDETIRAVREISSDLRPGVLDDLGLVAALDWQLKEFQDMAGINCSLHARLDDDSMDAGLRTALFRIAQEALTNVARHSGATHVEVRLAGDENYLLLEVMDNGRGIREEEIASRGSLGILGMKERAREFGGELEIRGGDGEGTVLAVKVPFNRAGARE